MTHYCTYFDAHYLSRGLAMIRSLLAKSESPCRIHVLCLDETCYRILNAIRIPGVNLVQLHEFEDPELLQAKSTRTLVEYYWTCTPSWLLFCLERLDLDFCTYLDADLFFYSPPRVLLEEMGDASILLTPHRFSPAYLDRQINGIFNVQFMPVRRDSNGLKALRWWRKACNAWCYYRLEEGKLGDQKYLDDWPTRFSGVHVLRHPGGAIGPWNVQQYEFLKRKKGGEALRAQLHSGGPDFPVVFYHFHNFRMFAGGYARSLFYDISDSAWNALYHPYASAVASAMKEMISKNPGLRRHGLSAEDEPVASVIRALANTENRSEPYLVYDQKMFFDFAGWRWFFFKIVERWRALVKGSFPSVVCESAKS